MELFEATDNELNTAQFNSLLDSIEMTGHTSESDQMLINVMRFRNNIATFNAPLDAYALDQATKYYTSRDDSRMMAWCYMLQGAYNMAIDESGARSIDMLKKAEDLSREGEDLLLNYAVSQQLFNINATIGNFDKAIKYARHMERYSRMMGDSARILVSIHYQNVSFGYMAGESNNKAYSDSAYAASRRSIPYIGNIKSHRLSVMLPYILNNIGFAMMSHGEQDSAMVYFEMARNERPVPATTMVFAGLADSRNDHAAADSLYRLAIEQCDTAPNIKHPQANLPALNRYYQFQTKHGRYEEACNILERIISVKDSLENAHQVFLVNELQTKYDQEVKLRNIDKRLYQSSAVVVLLAIIVAALVMYLRFRSIRQKAERLKMQGLLSAMQRQVLELEASGQDESKKIDLLKERIRQMETDTVQSIHQGKALYDHINDGGNTSTWHRDDFENFIEYYKLLDLPFIVQIEENYAKLSPKNMFFLILSNMGKSNEEMQSILGIGASTVRTIRSRINKQLINSNETAKDQHDDID